ncbi:MAG: hypothetical protein R2791_03215 [Saprospiraceae bacterium]
MEHYQCRFQIEFLFRGCQSNLLVRRIVSTNQTKIENHVNLALSAVSVAKAAHWLPLPKDQRGPFSMAELKTITTNLLTEIFGRLGFEPNRNKK